MRKKLQVISVIILFFCTGMSAYAGSFKFLGVISQDLSSFGKTGVAVWAIPESPVSGSPLSINRIAFSSTTGDGYVTDGVDSTISCNISFELDDESVRTYAVTIHSGGSESYSLPDSIKVTKIYAGNCRGHFTNTNDNTVDFKSDRNNGYATVMALNVFGDKFSQGVFYLGLKGSLATTPGCTVDIDNPGIIVNGTAYDYKQGFAVNRILNIKCSEGSPNPNISLSSTGSVINGCVLLQNDSQETGPKTCVFDGSTQIPVDLSKSANIAVDQTGKAEKEITFKISSADDQVGLSGGVYTSTILIVVSPL